MRTSFTPDLNRWLLLVALMLPMAGRAAQFVEVTAELQVDYWDNILFFDKLGYWPESRKAPTLFATQKRRCVIGTNSWMMELAMQGCTITRWFTGSNVVEHSVYYSQGPYGFDSEKGAMEGNAVKTNVAWIPHPFTTVDESVDGNPGRPARVMDLMGFDTVGRIFWLAFCSAPCLRHEGYKLYPPDSIWKENAIYFYGWKDEVEVFKDGLGLPKTVNLVSTNKQNILVYQVHQTTNFMGWTLPAEFFGVQYLETGTNGNSWRVDLTFKGRITSVKEASEPVIPAEVREKVGK